jgi:hypothetical protein
MAHQTVAVLSFGDKQLLVVAIAHGGDDEWNNRHAAGRDCQALYPLGVALRCTSTTWANVVVIAEKRMSVTPPFSKFMACPISRAG